MKIIKDPPSHEATEGQGKIEISELKEMSGKMFGTLVKAMIDIEKSIMAVDAPLHSDLMELLIEQESSEPKNLWGINIHPDKTGSDFIEFDSMMNLKPALGNKTRGVDDPEIREKINTIVSKLIVK